MAETVETGAKQSDVGTGATQADVAAAARAAASAAQTAATQAAAAADAAQSAANTFTQTEAVSDISQAEAYIVNLKRVVENALTLDHRVAQGAITFDEQLKQVALQNLQLGQTALQNAVALANRVNNGAIDNDNRTKGNDETHDKQMDACSVSERERTVRVGDVSNTVQQAALSDNPVLQDAAIAAAIVAGIKAYNENKTA